MSQLDCTGQVWGTELRRNVLQGEAENVSLRRERRMKQEFEEMCPSTN